MANKKTKSPTIIDGVLEAFAETGTEGIIWSIYDEKHNTADGKRQYSGLNSIKNGDILTVFNDKARKDVLWEGKVKLEFETQKQAALFNPNYKQQAVFGFWVHGLQEGMDAKQWAKMFFDEKPARVTRKSPKP